ncbi:MAG: hypothetical protein AMK72_01230 [Planctomycetes bacterium SM23_25]|nr:MAG: hypothetical protein AMK72_01230 [Planctomycetes bacterium SM23_25]
MHNCDACTTSSCPGKLSRRGLLAGAGATAAAAEMRLFDFASSLFAGEPRPAGKPVVNVVFVRPEKPITVSWPGGNCDTNAQQALFTKALRAAADKLDVRLQVLDRPIVKPGEVQAYLAQLKKAPPDGLIVGAMCLFRWGPVKQIVDNRQDIPTIIYSHLSGFTQHLQLGRKTPGVLMAATQSIDWLGTAVRMLNAIWRLKNTRILDTRRKFKPTAHELGTKFVGCSVNWQEEIGKARETAEARAIADFYAKNARKIVEPTKAEIVEAAKQYAVLRRLMAAHDCQGISLHGCLIAKPPCLAASKLRDEGIVATCEGVLYGAVGELLTFLLFNRPTFIQDPSPNTINNTLIGAHCTSPIRLEGIDKPYRAPYQVRDYHSRQGVSMQVLWPEGKKVTILQLGWPRKTMWVGTGRVVSNIAQPPSGCCRTAVEITVDSCEDTRDVKGFHQLFILGDLERPLRQFAKLAGIKVSGIC